MGGEYLRADGHANQPWSIKVSGRPVVYIEHCLMEQLLSFFPEKMRKRHFTSTDQSRAELQPAAWRTKAGQTILTLSPESRFQLATAILYVESLFHPNVSPSSAGAIGPFQVLPTTGDQMKLPQVDIPKVNLQAGLKYILFIEEQIAKHCDIDDRSKESSSHYRNLIAASYNAGPGYMTKRDQSGKAYRLAAYPKFSRTEYLERFQRAMGYQFLPAYLNYDPAKKLLRR